jgi:hypothetical protein
MFCMSSDEDCDKQIRENSIQTAVPQALFDNYKATFFAKAIADAGLQAAQCPFCSYLEELPAPAKSFFKFPKSIDVPPAMYRNAVVVGLAISVFFIPADRLYLLFITAVLLGKLSSNPRLQEIMRIMRKRMLRGKLARWMWPPQTNLILNCKKCTKASCVECKKEFKPLHKCHEEAQDSLRVHVENAMSDALIRTCPACHIRFSKVDVLEFNTGM